MIFHIAVATEWEAALGDGAYRPPSFAAEGFIHCSTREQVIATANLYYRGRRDLVLLSIDENWLTAPLRYETPIAPADVRAAQRFPHAIGANDGRENSRFPHIYGPLSLDAVVRTEAFPCSADGSFELPAGCRG